MLQESSEGTQAWVGWRDLMHFLDILCCCLVLCPIVASIRHLRMTAETDGKAHMNLKKLMLFRSFYMAVVAYIYVTRIALYLLAASLPYSAVRMIIRMMDLSMHGYLSILSIDRVLHV